MADTLIRETAPPAGAPASPVPQVWDPVTESYIKVEGSEGAQKVGADDGKIATLGAKADAAETDPTLSASEIALLKGLLKQLQGTGPVVTPVSLNGRKAEKQVLLITLPYSVPASSNVKIFQSTTLASAGWKQIGASIRWDTATSSNINIRNLSANGEAFADNSVSFSAKYGGSNLVQITSSGVDVYVGNNDTVQHDLNVAEVWLFVN